MTDDRTRRELLRAGAGLGVLAVAGCLGGDGEEWTTAGTIPAANAHQYSAPGCRCCERYASYIGDALEGSLTTSVPDDVDARKRELGIPAELRSCHTLVLDGYVVEGHVPASVVARLLDEAPDVGGVALPGMPAGSPGMGGSSQGPLTVHVVGGGRTGEVFAEVSRSGASIRRTSNPRATRRP